MCTYICVWERGRWQLRVTYCTLLSTGEWAWQSCLFAVIINKFCIHINVFMFMYTYVHTTYIYCVYIFRKKKKTFFCPRCCCVWTFANRLHSMVAILFSVYLHAYWICISVVKKCWISSTKWEIYEKGMRYERNDRTRGDAMEKYLFSQMEILVNFSAQNVQRSLWGKLEVKDIIW